MIRDGFIIKKPDKCTSTFRQKRWKRAKKLGRHMGLGKRRGTQEARMPRKVLWMRRQRVLRRLLKKYREEKKIEKDLYNELYVKCKGNQFKNKKVLIEHIHHVKMERTRAKKLAERLTHRRNKARAARDRKNSCQKACRETHSSPKQSKGRPRPKELVPKSLQRDSLIAETKQGPPE